MGNCNSSEIKTKLIEIGVDAEILNQIDAMPPDEQTGVYTFFTEIMNDELLFVLALKNPSFATEYLNRKKQFVGLS